MLVQVARLLGATLRAAGLQIRIKPIRDTWIEGAKTYGTQAEFTPGDGVLTYGHVSFFRGPTAFLGVSIDAKTRATSVGYSVAGRGVGISVSPRPTTWISTEEWLNNPKLCPHTRLTEVVIFSSGHFRWHLWAGRADLERETRVRWWRGSHMWSRIRGGSMDLWEIPFGPAEEDEVLGDLRLDTIPLPEGDYGVSWQRVTKSTAYKRGGWRRESVDLIRLRARQGIAVPGSGKADEFEFEFDAHTRDPGEALTWWRNKILERRGGEAWTPKVRARHKSPIAGPDGNYTWEKRDPLTGEWENVGSIQEDKIPEAWTIEPTKIMAHLLRVGMFGIGALLAGSYLVGREP